MAPEEQKQSEAEVKTAARKRAPRARKAAVSQAGGEAGVPAASAEAAAPAPAPRKRSAAPRKKTTRKAAEETPAAAPVAEAPAAPAPVVENAPEAAPAAEPKPRKEQRPQQNRPQKNIQPKPQNQPAAPAPAEQKAAAPAGNSSDIENPDAAPQLPPAPGFAVPETVGGGEGGSGNRRKRRRNRNRNRDNGQQPQQAQNTPQVDPQELVRRAWKIFLGEVTEEGLALMDDRTAAEASRRAFRVAELFLQEAARHRPSTPAAGESVEELAAEEPTEDAGLE